LKNEYCVYLTHENPDKIKNQMREFGIDIDKFINNGSLHICQIPDLLNHPDGPLVGFQKFFNKIMPNPRPRFRVVGRAINDTTNEKGWAAEMEIEKFTHSNFDKLNGMILCCYEYHKLGYVQRIPYLSRLLDYHNGLIFSSFTNYDFATAYRHD
jgi:hypothetical protein